MKFEAVLLKSLFAACLLICVLAAGSMITARPSNVAAAQTSADVVASN